MTYRNLLILTTLVAALYAPAQAQGTHAMKLVFSCQPANDLYQVLSSGKAQPPRFDTPEEAVQHAPTGAGVLILAQGYPETPTPLDATLFETATAKNLRLYIEYPSYLPDTSIGEVQTTRWERAVVSSDFFAPGLEKLRILAIHDCHFVPIQADKVDLVVARIAGFDTAIYGLPEAVHPILFEHPGGNALVATTKLSQFVTARYAPSEAWQTIINRLLQWLAGDSAVPQVTWKAPVRPSYVPGEVLPGTAERDALRRGAQWYFNAKLFVNSDWPDDRSSWEDLVGPVPETEWEVGDGSAGMLEGFSSAIRCDGSQYMRWWLRNDCMGEATMALAFDGAINGNDRSRTTAGNLGDFIFFDSDITKGPRNDPDSPSCGLMSWDVNKSLGVFYGDDNARSLLGSLAAASLLKTDRWDEKILRCLLANLRTTGQLGFRTGRLDEGPLHEKGWQSYFLDAPINPAPHYESYMWACYLWAYDQTGYDLFLERAKSAIRLTMEAYPEDWRWTNGIQQERARMMFPLAWLVRVEDTPEHRGWLRRVGKDLIAFQDECGAFREELGAPGKGSYGGPKTNEAYGTAEAPLIQENGDPLCDLLYTTNFAFLGLHEAARATGEAMFIDAEDKLADFLCRIQIRSESHPELDGAWFRAFEYARWEYWASNADLGWGAWSIESGWTCGWINAILALRHMDTSLWELTADSTVERHFDALHEQMLGKIPEPKRVKNAATGRTVSLATAYAPQYSGGGDSALCDGLVGDTDHTNSAWQGYQGADLDATINLGDAVHLKTLRSNYLQSTRVGIFLPTSVEYAISEDGVNFRVLGTVNCDISQKKPGPFIHTFSLNSDEPKVRFIRVRAKNITTIPDWHEAKGRKAWLFVDEVIAE